jgi:hypothetical protein
MLKLVSISIAALAASSAFAQVVDPAAPSASPSPSAGAPAAAQPGALDPATPAQPGTSTGDPAASSGAAAASPVAAVIDSQFPTYDKDKSGTLSGPEFKQWIADLKAQEMTSEGKPADPAVAKQYAATAWKAADKNKDGTVSKDELTAFLSG